jgi:hyperosmotically inducible protein
MLRRLWTRAVPAAAFLLLTAGLAAVGQDDKTTGEKIKEKAGEIGSTIKRGAVSVEEALKAQFQRARAAVTKMGVESRVYARLHWDKALAGSKIELTAPRAGAIRLSGVVPDAKARAKAVELATDTVGVTEVIDNLAVQTTATPATPAPGREPR